VSSTWRRRLQRIANGAAAGGALVVGLPLGFGLELDARDLIPTRLLAAVPPSAEADPRTLDPRGRFRCDWIGSPVDDEADESPD
jgi:hypothetical protein